jgi:Ca2+-transporting ATPase
VLKSGDKVPADMRLLRTRDLQVAEASLTGESLPVQKDAAIDLPADTILAERINMAYASTLVTFGQGTGVVTAIGDNSEVGRISNLLSEAEDLATPLTRKMAQFSKVVLYAILGLAAVTFAISISRGQPLVDTLMAAIALAVAMIPEGLPAALTVTLAIGVSRMAQRRAIIRKLPAVEALGNTTIICTDKTGTLTQNQMTVQKIVVPGARYDVSGLGYNPEGSIVPATMDADLPRFQTTAAPKSVVLEEVLTAGLLSNDSELQQGREGWEAQGDPTEVALIVSAYKSGLVPDETRNKLPRIDAIPFESQHQYMATLHDQGEGLPRLVYVKGAAEVILERSHHALDDTGALIPIQPADIQRDVENMASEGLRVLAFARIELPASMDHITHEDLQTGLTFLGLQGLIDPPRSEAITAVKTCQAAGIHVKMITGDHALTAAAIARQIGLNGASSPTGSPKVMTGKELSQLTDSELIEKADQYSVFARVSPEQKLRLVEALQARGHIVAMTGDGVNDGPALKKADIGVAMGITGTDVAKEASDMVLTDDNFATIEAAVEEGRGIFDNLTKIIAWSLPTNVGEGLILLVALLLGIALPILPIQILWINMVSVSILGIVLAMEVREEGIMKRPPRKPSASILSRELVWRVLLVGVLILIGAFGLFELELVSGASLAQARTVAVNAVVMIEIFYLLNCRSLTHSMFRIGVFSNPWVVIGIAVMILLQLAFTYIPLMNTWLSSAPISLDAWVRILLVSLASYLIVELEKWLRRRKATSGTGAVQTSNVPIYE